MTAQCQEKGQIKILLIQNLIVNLKIQEWSTNMAYQSYGPKKTTKKKKKKGMTKKAKPMKMRKMRY